MMRLVPVCFTSDLKTELELPVDKCFSNAKKMSRLAEATIPTNRWRPQRYDLRSFLNEPLLMRLQNPPLYLHITSTSKEGLEKAVAKIKELMQQELPQLVDERRFRRRDQEQVERDEFGRVSCTPHNNAQSSSL